jgi:hypothetical protein
MDDLERSESSHELEQWIQESSALLTPPPDWEPNLNVARARLEARLHRRSRTKRYLLVAATAAAFACVVFYTVVPSGRALAQQISGNGFFVIRLYRVDQLWRWITLVRPGPMLLGNLAEDLRSLHTQALTESVAPQVVSDVAEAAQRAGFIPRLPHSDVLVKSPKLSILGPMSYGTVVRTADLERVLASRGVSDQDVPKSWDGSQITLQIGTTVTAEWTDVPNESSGKIEWSEVTLTQGPPPVVTTPAGFDLTAFTVANLRAAGLRNREAALKLGKLNTTALALLLGNNRTQKHVGVREVDLPWGPATLIEEFGNGSAYTNWLGQSAGPKVERVTLLWSVPDRVYVLSGTMRVPSEMVSLDFASDLTEAVNLAITTY